MSVYRRGETWWYKFSFNGQQIRESAKTPSKTVARQAEQSRRRDLELAVNRIPRRERLPLFPRAAEVWLSSKTHLAPKSKNRYDQCVDALKLEFGQRLICDIDDRDISGYQQKRLSEGVSNRTVNYEVGTLRGILKKFRLWSPIADGVNALRERHDIGKAITSEDERALLSAISTSRSPSLLPLFLVSLDTGLRFSEIQCLRLCDVNFTWRDDSIVAGEIIVPKSKTEAGKGRLVPLTRRACASLTLWMTRFPKSQPENFLFPHHLVGIAGNVRTPHIRKIDLDRPIGSWRKAWRRACAVAGVRYRWHDLRHSFISRLLENPTISEDTAKALAGHVSRKMLERYSHVRSAAKAAAIMYLQAHVDSEIARMDEELLRKGGHKSGHNHPGTHTQ